MIAWIRRFCGWKISGLDAAVIARNALNQSLNKSCSMAYNVVDKFSSYEVLVQCMERSYLISIGLYGNVEEIKIQERQK